MGRANAARRDAQTPAEKLEIEYRLKVVGCVKDGDAAAALEVYAQMKAEAELTVPAYMYPMVLNVCCNHEQSASFQQGAFEVFQDMKQAATATTAKRGARRGAGVDETVYSALIKLCSKARDFGAAEALIAEMEAAGTAPKLRTFAPLLEAFSDAGDLAKCEALLATISGHAIPITEAEHVAMLNVCEKNGDTDKFYTYLDAFIDDVAQPGAEAWAVLQRWFARCVLCWSACLDDARGLTHDFRGPDASSDAAKVDGRGWTISEETVDARGVCSATGDQLASMELSEAATKEMLEKVDCLECAHGCHRHLYRD